MIIEIVTTITSQVHVDEGEEDFKIEHSIEVNANPPDGLNEEGALSAALGGLRTGVRTLEELLPERA